MLPITREVDIVATRASMQRENPRKGDGMARRTVLVSDLSGEEIDAKDAAQVIIRYSDARRGQVILDVNATEVEDLASRGQRQARRGRKPRAQAV
jgi:hypothetical protein